MAYYFGDALSEIKKIKGKEDGHLDMSSLPTFAQRKTTVQKKVTNEKGKVILDENGHEKFTDEPADGRDIGAMVSILTVGVQQLLGRIEELERNNG